MNDVVLRHQTRRRAIELAAVVALAIALMVFEPLHELTARLLERVTAVIAVHPSAGKAIFVVASAISAILAFFSSAIVVPAAVMAWGPRTTLLLLWIAWLAGGCCTYAIGRTLGGCIAAWLVSPERLAYYAGRISRNASFPTVLLFQIALPSEIPGYTLGTVRYPFPRYLAALAIAEAPLRHRRGLPRRQLRPRQLRAPPGHRRRRRGGERRDDPGAAAEGS